VEFKNGKVVDVGQSFVSDKLMTFTSEGIAANGQPYRQVVVFDRQ
jgi:hypothetical protein